MKDVVIIGGGLSGLSAAYELEQRQIPYRLIEVKPRLGGSIVTERYEQRFVLDGGPFVFPRVGDWSFLSELGLSEDVFCSAYDSHRRDLVAFKDGTQIIIDALAKRLTGILIHRIAVSSLGQLNGRFTLCLENGLMWDAAALIVAAPARHAERLFRTLAPQVSQQLFNYLYDSIYRISLVYRKADMPQPPLFPWDVAIPFYYWVDDRARVLADHLLIHVGVRLPLDHTSPETLIHWVHGHLKARNQPVIARADVWPEADPLPPHTPDFQAKMTELQTFLPPGIALIGSDYHGLTLAQRFNAGRAAAQRIAAQLK
jgi:protoporphyrinogen oxidase